MRFFSILFFLGITIKVFGQSDNDNVYKELVVHVDSSEFVSFGILKLNLEVLSENGESVTEISAGFQHSKWKKIKITGEGVMSSRDGVLNINPTVFSKANPFLKLEIAALKYGLVKTLDIPVAYVESLVANDIRLTLNELQRIHFFAHMSNGINFETAQRSMNWSEMVCSGSPAFVFSKGFLAYQSMDVPTDLEVPLVLVNRLRKDTLFHQMVQIIIPDRTTFDFRAERNTDPLRIYVKQETIENNNYLKIWGFSANESYYQLLRLTDSTKLTVLHTQHGTPVPFPAISNDVLVYGDSSLPDLRPFLMVKSFGLEHEEQEMPVFFQVIQLSSDELMKKVSAFRPN